MLQFFRLMLLAALPCGTAFATASLSLNVQGTESSSPYTMAASGAVPN